MCISAINQSIEFYFLVILTFPQACLKTPGGFSAILFFEDTTKELLRYPEFAGIFSMDEQWRLESLRLAHEQINEDFTIQEDPL